MALIYKSLARRMPGLGLKLRQAKMAEEPEEYIQKTVSVALLLSFGMIIIAFLFTKIVGVIFFLPIMLVISFFYLIRRVDVQILKLQKQISQEIVFAGRYLLIEIESGVPMYQAFKNLAMNYDYVGPYFAEIIEKVDLGTTLEDAVNETIILSPDVNFRKLLWQVLNSMKTGSDVSHSLETVLDQIIREQQIMVKEYGRKLNPIAMFYMMAGIIVPSLGITMIVAVSMFAGFELNLMILLILAGFIGFIQLMFVNVIRSARPPMEL